MTCCTTIRGSTSGRPSSARTPDDWWTGGIDEVVPTGHPAMVGGEQLPFLGEVWSQAWSSRIVAEGPDAVAVELGCAGIITPFRIERRMELRAGESFVRSSHRLTNVGYEPMPFMWGIHPGLAIRPGALVQVPGTDGDVPRGPRRPRRRTGDPVPVAAPAGGRRPDRPVGGARTGSAVVGARVRRRAVGRLAGRHRPGEPVRLRDVVRSGGLPGGVAVGRLRRLARPVCDRARGLDGASGEARRGHRGGASPDAGARRSHRDGGPVHRLRWRQLGRGGRDGVVHGRG